MLPLKSFQSFMFKFRLKAWGANALASFPLKSVGVAPFTPIPLTLQSHMSVRALVLRQPSGRYKEVEYET